MGRGAGYNPPPLQTSTEAGALSIPFIESFTDRRAQKGARGSLQPRGSLGGEVVVGGSIPSPPDGAGGGHGHRTPPARQQHGLAYGTDTCYNATLPNTHRRAPGGPGRDRGGGRAAPAAPGAGGGRGAVQRRRVLNGTAPGKAERTLGTRGTVLGGISGV